MYGFKVRRQYGIDNYVIDFYCLELKIAIEVDGIVHHFPDKEKTDKRKNIRLKELGIALIRIDTFDLEDDYESTVLYLEDLFKERAQALNISIDNKSD